MATGPGRPRGRTAEGEATKQRLYRAAIRLFARQGFEATTMRQIAKAGHASPGLLYRYFEDKDALLIALYENLSTSVVDELDSMPDGSWTTRASFAIRAVLRVLEPHRDLLRSALSVLLTSETHGLLADRNRVSHQRVVDVFERVVADADDVPTALADALPRLLYTAHLAVILLWVLDRSPDQRATRGVLDLADELRPLLTVAWQLPGIPSALQRLRGHVVDALELT